MKKLIILVGNIASGKSTYVKKFPQAIIVNDDSIVSSVHGGDYTLYQKELKPLYKTIENTIITTALSLDRLVIIDRPNMSKQTRQRYISIAKSLDVEVLCVIFPLQDPYIHAKRRFDSDNRDLTLRHWIETAERKNVEFEHPSFDEGFDNIFIENYYDCFI